MRLKLYLTGNTAPVPYDNLHQLTRTLHKWLGRNNGLHDALSLYSFGWLQGAIPQNGHLTFPRGAMWQLSFYDPGAAKQVLAGILRDPEVAWGMRVHEVREEAVPAFGGVHRFKVDGPVLARTKRPDGSRAYLLWNDRAADEAITQVLRRKLVAAGFDGAHLEAEVAFDRTYPKARTKLAEIKGTKHKGSECPVIVKGTPESVRFAWLVGVGELTGCGFGALK